MSNISNEIDSKIAELERIFSSSSTSANAYNSPKQNGTEYIQSAGRVSGSPNAKTNTGRAKNILISLTAATLFTGAGVATTFMTGQDAPAVYRPGIWQSYNWGQHLDPHQPDATALIHQRLQQGTINVPASTITGIVDSASMSSALYWTFVLKNHNSENKEAAFEIELPKGSALSRATLWMNGVQQEAAFSANEVVQEAYDWVIVRNRDPLLITQVGPHRIKVLASPVMANGGEMKLRIGLTAPIQIDNQGRKILELPHVVKSNLKFDNKQDVHLSSDTKLGGIGQLDDSGIYLLRANLEQDQMKSAQIQVSGKTPKRFATRLMHTSPAEYLLAEVEDGRLQLKRSKQIPSAKLVKDEDVVSRLSSLWAHQEIERLAARGQKQQACEIANIFRVVSSVSGAVVLEQENDYLVNGLNRHMYQTVGANTARGVATGANPMLQGATSGTIGPMGSDATVIQGVNTAAVVRTNNFVYLELILKYMAYAFQFIGIALAVFLTRDAFHKPASCLSARIQLGIVALLVGATGVYAPTIMNFLVQVVFESNILS